MVSCAGELFRREVCDETIRHPMRAISTRWVLERYGPMGPAEALSGLSRRPRATPFSPRLRRVAPGQETLRLTRLQGSQKPPSRLVAGGRKQIAAAADG